MQRRTVEGYKLKEFLGRGVVQAPIGRVLAVIRDANRRAEWMPACADSHLVEENLAARTQVAYHRTKAPWPVSDRDSVNRAEMIVEPTSTASFCRSKRCRCRRCRRKRAWCACRSCAATGC